MILIFLDGVLRDESKHGAIYEGLALFRLFKDATKVVVLAKNQADAERWCKQNNILKVDEIVDYDIPAIGTDPDFRLVEYCRARGGLQLVITSDPRLAAKLLEIGVHTLLFLHPSYMRHEFRPDSRQGVKPWADIHEEINRQKEMMVGDERV